MREMKVKIGYDEDTNMLSLFIKPTVSLDKAEVVKDDAKVFFTVKNGEVRDIRIAFENKHDFLRNFGEGESCPVCFTLKEFSSKIHSLRRNVGEDEEKLKKLALLMLLEE